MTEDESRSIKHKGNKPLLMKRHNLTQLTVICATAHEWGMSTGQPHGLTPTCWKQSYKAKRVI